MTDPAVAPRDSDAPEVRYLTLAEARAIECNGCGDCCDSRRTDGFWTWGSLPGDQYAGLTTAGRLILPLERTDAGWRDRGYEAADAQALTPTRFRCAAFEPHVDGGGGCGVHDQPRPRQCGEFPVWGGAVEADLGAQGEVWLQTGAFPRCSWFRMCVVHDGDPRLNGAGRAEEA